MHADILFLVTVWTTAVSIDAVALVVLVRIRALDPPTD